MPDPKLAGARNVPRWVDVPPDGSPWPAELRAARHKGGVYAIRTTDLLGTRVVYVGESERRLYDTLTRHFQRWNRSKNFWRGFLGPATDPGQTYDRAGSQIRWQVLPAARVMVAQLRWIVTLKPADNILGKPAPKSAPF